MNYLLVSKRAYVLFYVLFIASFLVWQTVSVIDEDIQYLTTSLVYTESHREGFSFQLNKIST